MRPYNIQYTYYIWLTWNCLMIFRKGMFFLIRYTLKHDHKNLIDMTNLSRECLLQHAHKNFWTSSFKYSENCAYKWDMRNSTYLLYLINLRLFDDNWKQHVLSYMIYTPKAWSQNPNMYDKFISWMFIAACSQKF